MKPRTNPIDFGNEIDFLTQGVAHQKTENRGCLMLIGLAALLLGGVILFFQSRGNKYPAMEALENLTLNGAVEKIRNSNDFNEYTSEETGLFRVYSHLVNDAWMVENSLMNSKQKILSIERQSKGFSLYQLVEIDQNGNQNRILTYQETIAAKSKNNRIGWILGGVFALAGLSLIVIALVGNSRHF